MENTRLGGVAAASASAFMISSAAASVQAGRGVDRPRAGYRAAGPRFDATSTSESWLRPQPWSSRV
jgi:hypothetical protein